MTVYMSCLSLRASKASHHPLRESESYGEAVHLCSVPADQVPTSPQHHHQRSKKQVPEGHHLIITQKHRRITVREILLL